MNARVNDSKFQMAAAVLVDALASKDATKQNIWSAAWPAINVLSTESPEDAQLLWHRLITGLNNLDQ